MTDRSFDNDSRISRRDIHRSDCPEIGQTFPGVPVALIAFGYVKGIIPRLLTHGRFSGVCTQNHAVMSVMAIFRHPVNRPHLDLRLTNEED
jgi:hypothetical protein